MKIPNHEDKNPIFTGNPVPEETQNEEVEEVNELDFENEFGEKVLIVEEEEEDFTEVEEDFPHKEEDLPQEEDPYNNNDPISILDYIGRVCQGPELRTYRRYK